MTIYEDKGRRYDEIRAHPWTVGAENAEFRYVDFKVRPDLIPETLEDFKPFANKSAIHTFYRFLEWINGPDSQLETNDCGFRPPKPHKDANSNKRLGCNGRLFIFYRQQEYNLIENANDWLFQAVFRAIGGIDSEFSENQGVIGLTRQAAYYTDFGNVPEEVLGEELMISFWSYGDTDEETFMNLERLFTNLWQACRTISDHAKANFKHDDIMADFRAQKPNLRKNKI